jgi:uncharacterized membrane protein YraQ (UPF0718 family)
VNTTGNESENNNAVEGAGDGPGEQHRTPLRKRIRWDWLFLALSATALIVLSMIFEGKGRIAGRVVWEYAKEMVFILPSVMVLMGLFAVWVNRETVVKYLGEGSGIKGFVLAALLGTLPTGPMYVAFPLAAVLLKKGARVANITIFLSAWACIKLPLELVEFQFMGWKFALLRLGLTVALVLPMGIMVEVLYNRGGRAQLQADASGLEAGD